MRSGWALLSLAATLVLLCSCEGFNGSLDARRYEAMKRSWEPIAEDYLEALQDRPPHDAPLTDDAMQLRIDAIEAHAELLEASNPANGEAAR